MCLNKTETQFVLKAHYAAKRSVHSQVTMTKVLPRRSICQYSRKYFLFFFFLVKPFGISKNGHYSFIMPASPLLELEMIVHMNEALGLVTRRT